MPTNCQLFATALSHFPPGSPEYEEIIGVMKRDGCPIPVTPVHQGPIEPRPFGIDVFIEIVHASQTAGTPA